MACGLALKRPHGRQYESYLNDADGYGEAKRARTSPHCTPFRPQMGTIAASLPSPSSSTASKFSAAVQQNANSPLAMVCHDGGLSSARLEAYLRSEIKNLRRRKVLPKTEGENDVVPEYSENSCRKIYRAPKSPTQSGSDSDGEVDNNVTNSMRRLEFTNKAQFSLEQVSQICERLLKEQEIRLRHEYEIALNKKLEEQHEQYVQYAAEQLGQQREAAGDDFAYSYLS